MARIVDNYGLEGPTTRGVKWLGTPEAVAQAWHDGVYPNSALRLFANGQICHGSGQETEPVYDALRKLQESSSAA